jgi:hypothetical protein
MLTGMLARRSSTSTLTRRDLEEAAERAGDGREYDVVHRAAQTVLHV